MRCLGASRNSEVSVRSRRRASLGQPIETEARESRSPGRDAGADPVAGARVSGSIERLQLGG